MALRRGSEGDLAFCRAGGASDSWCSAADVTAPSLLFHCDLHVGDSRAWMGDWQPSRRSGETPLPEPRLAWALGGPTHQ